MSLKSALAVVRRFQSETEAIREAPDPISARLTVFVLTGFLVAIVVLMCVSRLDRVVTSSAGKVVTRTELLSVFQALDPSLIKSIDVREGDQVKAGQLLATLDQTFAEADVKQLKLQIASLEAQTARDEAELAGKPLAFKQTSDPDLLKYQALQKDYYDQHVAQYNAQINSFDAKIKQLQATIQKLEADQVSYNQRGDIAGKIEAMRTELEKKGAGSLLNLLQSQDARIELARQIENTRNSLGRIQTSLGFRHRRSRSLPSAMVHATQSGTGQGARRSRQRSRAIRQSPKASGSCSAHGARTFRRPDDGQSVSRVSAHLRLDLFDADAIECPRGSRSALPITRHWLHPNRRSLHH